LSLAYLYKYIRNYAIKNSFNVKTLIQIGCEIYETQSMKDLFTTYYEVLSK